MACPFFGEVRVLRSSKAKMRLRRDFDAAATAGYRDVQISARLHTPAARRLGVHDHTVEIQLHLEAFIQLKSGGGHKLYVQCRNRRGT